MPCRRQARCSAGCASSDVLFLGPIGGTYAVDDASRAQREPLYPANSSNMSSSSSMQSIGRWIGNNILYSEALASDQRLPCITFSIAGSRYGLLAPSLQFWLALGTCLLLGAIYSTVLSCIMYKFIIFPRKQQQHPDTSTTSLLVGFGFIVPLCVIYPYYGIHFFLIKNKVIKFLFGIASLTTAFRCSEV